jgi:hypothetical protein
VREILQQARQGKEVGEGQSKEKIIDQIRLILTEEQQKEFDRFLMSR